MTMRLALALLLGVSAAGCDANEEELDPSSLNLDEENANQKGAEAYCRKALRCKNDDDWRAEAKRYSSVAQCARVVKKRWDDERGGKPCFDEAMFDAEAGAQCIVDLEDTPCDRELPDSCLAACVLIE